MDSELRTQVLPILASQSELDGLGTVPTVRLGNTDCRDARVHEQDHIAGNTSHDLIERIASAVGILLGRPRLEAGKNAN
jgi:hypothetical protein